MGRAQIVLIVGHDSVVENAGVQPGDKLTYQHPDMNIYVRWRHGVSRRGRWPQVDHAALVAAQAWGLKAGKVRRVDSVRHSGARKNEQEQKAKERTQDMFE